MNMNVAKREGEPVLIFQNVPKDELPRLASLREQLILDTSYESQFDEIAKLCALICDVPIAMIGFVDANREWFKAKDRYHGP